MTIDWGEALAAGIGAGATGIGQQYQADQEQARWLEKQKQLMAMQSQQQQQQQRYLLALKPPEVDKQSITDASGKPMIQNRQWVMPTDEELKAGKSGHFDVTSTAPDINFERLQETQRNNDIKNEYAQDRLKMQGDYNTARIETAQARLEAQQARAEKATQGKLVRQVDANGLAVYGTVKDGQFTPVVDENGDPLQSHAWRKRGQFSANGTRTLPTGQTVAVGQRDEIGPSYPTNPYEDDVPSEPQGKGPVKVSIVDPGGGAPLSQFSGAKTTAKPKATGAPGSSADNPISYTKGMPKPPSGTYVRKPDGTVVRAP